MAKLKPFARGSFLALLVVHASLTIGVAHADDADREARERYESAVKLYEDGAYDAALVELNRAAELRPSYKLYYNIGQVRFAMHDYAAAIEAYRQYLDKGGDKVPGARREQLKKELNTLNQRVAKLNVETDVAGAEVFVDDVLVGSTPLAAPVVVNSGIRRIAVRHPDYVPQVRRLNIAGGVQERASFVLVNGGAAVASPASVTPDAPASRAAPSANSTVGDRALGVSTPPAPAPGKSSAASPSARGVPWLGWAITGALAAGATVTGVITMSRNSSLADDRKTLDASPADLDSKASKVRTLAVVTDGLAIAALVAGGVSLWLTLGSSNEANAQPQQKANPKSLRLGFGLGGLSMKAAF